MDTNITMVKGDTLTFNVEYENTDIDLDSAYFSCKKNFADTDYLFQRSLGSGIDKISNGLYAVHVLPENTENIPAGHYVYDFEVGIRRDKFTILRGILTIQSSVTRA